jgi:hypothetical protein
MNEFTEKHLPMPVEAPEMMTAPWVSALKYLRVVLFHNTGASTTSSAIAIPAGMNGEAMSSALISLSGANTHKI